MTTAEAFVEHQLWEQDRVRGEISAECLGSQPGAVQRKRRVDGAHSHHDDLGVDVVTRWVRCGQTLRATTYLCRCSARQAPRHRLQETARRPSWAHAKTSGATSAWLRCR